MPERRERWCSRFTLPESERKRPNKLKPRVQRSRATTVFVVKDFKVRAIQDFFRQFEAILELREKGFCVLKGHLEQSLIRTCKARFWPTLLAYINANRLAPNRGPHRHFLPVPFDGTGFFPELFFDDLVLRIVRGTMDE